MKTAAMDTKQVFCARCSSADSLNIRIGTEIAEGYCPRCDKSFRATPCQECGGFRVDGSYGVSGARFERLPDTRLMLGLRSPQSPS